MLLWQVDVHAAAENNQIAALELVAEWAPERINETNKMGSTPLHATVLQAVIKRLPSACC